MKNLILNFRSKKLKKIKNPKILLGGKGANLSEMGKIGLPVPPGFTSSTKVCDLFYKNKKKLPRSIILLIKVLIKKRIPLNEHTKFIEREYHSKLFFISGHLFNKIFILIHWVTIIKVVTIFFKLIIKI